MHSGVVPYGMGCVIWVVARTYSIQRYTVCSTVHAAHYHTTLTHSHLAGGQWAVYCIVATYVV